MYLIICAIWECSWRKKKVFDYPTKIYGNSFLFHFYLLLMRPTIKLLGSAQSAVSKNRTQDAREKATAPYTLITKLSYITTLLTLFCLLKIFFPYLNSKHILFIWSTCYCGNERKFYSYEKIYIFFISTQFPKKSKHWLGTIKKDHRPITGLNRGALISPLQLQIRLFPLPHFFSIRLNRLV